MKFQAGRLTVYPCLLLSLVLAGCATPRPSAEDEAAREGLPKQGQVVVVPPARVESIGPHASKFALMAIFAKVVYRKDLPAKTRNDHECAYLKSAEPLTVGIPTDSGWSRWKGPNGEGCVFDGGLALEIYVHQGPHGLLDKAVIAYRGTENFNLGAALADWKANLSAPLGIEPAQYVRAQKHLDRAIPALLKENRDIEIYATGHSLGGGLAQQAGYYAKAVKEVFAFDPSPVTNWMQLKNATKIANPDPTIYRVYHWNEALAHVRNVTTRFNGRRFGRHDYEFYFQDVPKDVGGAVDAHEMGILACHLAANIPGDTADHGLTKKSALELLNDSYRTPANKPAYDVHPICPTGVLLPKELFVSGAM